MRNLLMALFVIAAVLAPSTSASAQQNDDGVTAPDNLRVPGTVDPNVLAGYIIPLEPDIRPLVVTIERPDLGLRETTGGEETVIALNADVFFDFDSDVVKPGAHSTLADLVDQLGGVPQIEVTGHTDSMGDDSYNLDLSRRRAESVAAVLAQLLPDLGISTDGRGESEPVAPNKTAAGEDFPEGRALNRRVEIRYTP